MSTQRCLATALGSNQARHLAALAVGDDDRDVEPDREAKSIGHEETFARNAHERSEMRTHLVRLADAVASRLRKAGVGARTLTLKVRFDDGFTTVTRSTTGSEAIDSAEMIVAVLEPMMEAIDPSPGIRLVGVSGSNLGPVFHQMTLDEAVAHAPTFGATDAALDVIRDRFGADAIGPASAVRGGEGPERAARWAAMGTGSIGRRSTAVPRPQKKASAWLVGESCSCPRLLDGSLGLVVAGAAATGVLVTGVVMTGGTTSVVPGDGAARGGPLRAGLEGSNGVRGAGSHACGNCPARH